MPHSTYKYPFEELVFEGCASLAKQLLGGSGIGYGFTMFIDSNGAIVLFQSSNIENAISQEIKSNYGMVFYDPFDAPVYTALRWINCTTEMIEKALDIKLEPKGLISIDGDALAQFPCEHSVMF